MILILLNMDKPILKKRGRPRLPESKMPVLRRMPEELIERVDAFLNKALAARHAGDLASIDLWLKEMYGFVGKVDEAASVPVQVVVESGDTKKLRQRVQELETKLESYESYGA